MRYSDYAMMARGLGMHAQRFERADELPAAIAEAMAHRPALLDVLVRSPHPTFDFGWDFQRRSRRRADASGLHWRHEMEATQ